jgi:hypothetical protein
MSFMQLVLRRFDIQHRDLLSASIRYQQHIPSIATISASVANRVGLD